MSMISAQCAELRAMAESVGLAMPQAATLMMGAADTIEGLEDENTRLREQMERLVTLLRNDCDIDASWDGLRRFWSIELTEGGCLMRDRACKAEAENASLRELLAELYDMAWHECPSAFEAAFADRMRELGVDA